MDEPTLAHKLFVDWSLPDWANVLEVIGTAVAVTTFFFTLFLNRKVKDLKKRWMLSKSVGNHFKSCTDAASNLNGYLNDYDSNRQAIRTEISVLHADLVILQSKVESEDAKHIKRLARTLNSVLKRRLAENAKTPQNTILKTIYKFFNADAEDVWNIYTRLAGVTRRIKEIKDNKPTP